MCRPERFLILNNDTNLRLKMIKYHCSEISKIIVEMSEPLVELKNKTVPISVITEFNINVIERCTELPIIIDNILKPLIEKRNN